jgi:hypothetical protein
MRRMPVEKAARLVLIGFVALLVAPVTTVQAATRMPIGFFDDSSFRFSPARQQNLAGAAAAGASVIHTTASWAAIAPTRPAKPSDGDDPVYRIHDLDELVFSSASRGLRVMINVTGTPKWANGNKTPNRLPTRLSDLTTFTRMLATRYNGRSGHGTVGLWSVWNEPNIELFLAPQYSGKKIVGPANYAKVYKAAYAGIKAGNKLAKVAIGETSARGRDKPLKGVSGSVAPGTFAKLLGKVKGLKFDAWAHHPYPTSPNLPPLQKVRYPNVTLSTLPTFEKQLKTSFHRSVPVWITEYGHETKPGEPKGVTTVRQAAYAKQALTIAKNDPNIQMFVWFVFRDSAGNPWQSGLELPSGARKPAFSPFSSLARLTDGQTLAGRAGVAPKVTIYAPYLGYYVASGTRIAISYTVNDGSKLLTSSTTSAALGTDQSLSFTPSFKPVKKHTYTVTAVASEPNGHAQTRVTLIKVA